MEMEMEIKMEMASKRIHTLRRQTESTALTHHAQVAATFEHKEISECLNTNYFGIESSVQSRNDRKGWVPVGRVQRESS